jgi:hypothetical protein
MLYTLDYDLPAYHIELGGLRRGCRRCSPSEVPAPRGGSHAVMAGIRESSYSVRVNWGGVQTWMICVQ